MHVAGRKTAPRDHRTPSGARRYPRAPKPSPEDHCATLAGREADGSTAGIWRGCGGLLADRSCERTCITRQSSAICAGLAVLRVPYMRSTARPRGIGSDCRAMHAPRAATPSRDDRTHPQVPAVIPERRDPAPGEPTPHLRRPPLKPESAPRPPRNQGPPPPGTDARRNGLPLGPLGIRPRQDRASRESSGWMPSGARPLRRADREPGLAALGRDHLRRLGRERARASAPMSTSIARRAAALT